MVTGLWSPENAPYPLPSEYHNSVTSENLANVVCTFLFQCRLRYSAAVFVKAPRQVAKIVHLANVFACGPFQLQLWSGVRLQKIRRSVGAKTEEEKLFQHCSICVSATSRVPKLCTQPELAHCCVDLFCFTIYYLVFVQVP